MKAIDLTNDPANSEMRHQKENEFRERERRAKESEALIIEDFKKHDLLDIDSLSQLLNQKKIKSAYSDIILKWIPMINNEYNVQEILIRALARAEKPFDGNLLIQIFDAKETSILLKWAIGNTIASAKILNIENWLEGKLNTSNFTKENEMLIYAAPKYFGIHKGAEMVRQSFDVYPLQSADVLSRIGNKKDLEFIKFKSELYQNEVKQQLKKYINKLQKRLS